MERRAHGRILAGILAFTAAAGMPIAATTVVLGTPTSASAQVLQVTSWFAYITDDETVIRCGHGDLMYPIASLKRGQVLRVDGEGQGWARVSYPTGVPAFVPADSVQVDVGMRTATLTKPSRLKAFNATTGLRGSWKDVFDNALPSGTKLTIMDSEPTPDGRGNEAWRILPPENARAFVPLSSLRRATPEEVRAFEVNLVAAPSASPQTTASRTPQEQPASAYQGRPTVASPSRPTPTDLTDPIVEPSPAAAQPVVQRDPAPPARRPAPAERSRFDRLESAFDAVRAQTADDAEFSELLSEFQSAIASLDDTPQNKGVRHRLQQRIEFLKLRADLQAQRRAFAEAQATLSDQDMQLAEKLAEVDRTRQYTIVGRLSASTIYDGERLPLMYRIQTAGGPAPRTVAYVRPDDKLNIEGRIGQIVGIEGEAQLDPTLRLNIITPRRVDALEATATAVVPEGN